MGFTQDAVEDFIRAHRRPGPFVVALVGTNPHGVRDQYVAGGRILDRNDRASWKEITPNISIEQFVLFDRRGDQVHGPMRLSIEAFGNLGGSYEMTVQMHVTGGVLPGGGEGRQTLSPQDFYDPADTDWSVTAVAIDSMPSPANAHENPEQTAIRRQRAARAAQRDAEPRRVYLGAQGAQRAIEAARKEHRAR